MMKPITTAKNLLFGCLLFLCVLDARGQTKLLDSLKRELENVKSDTLRTLLLNEIGWEYIMTGDYEYALKYSLQGLELSKKNPKQRGATGSLNNLGTIYVTLSDYARALEYFNQSLQLTEKYHNEIGTAGLYNNIGIIHNHLNDFESAIFYHNKSLALQRKLNNPKGIAQCQVNISGLYLKQKKYAQCIPIADSAARFYEQEKNMRDMALPLNTIGAAYMYMGEFEKAKTYFDRILAINIEVGNKREIATIYQNLGSVLQRMNKLNEALDYFQKAYELSKTLGSLEQQQSSAQGLYEIYKAKGDYRNTVVYLEIFGALRDSMFNSEQNQKINNMKTKFALDRQESELKTQARLEAQQEHEKQEAVKARQRYIIYSVAGVLAIALVFAGFVFNRFKVTKRQKHTIEKQKNEISIQHKIVEEKQKEIIDSINYAKRIQYALLAHDEILKANLPEHFVYFQPRDIVSGDFYWATLRQDGDDSGAFYLAVCDSTGHGVPGAFMSLLNISFLNEAINEKNIADPADVFGHIRHRLIENISQEGQKDGMDGILVKFERTSITYAAANNHPVLIRNKNGMELPCDKMPIGKGENDKSFETQTIQAQKGDMLYLYTDGFADQFGGNKGKKFKYSQLNQLLAQVSDLQVEQQKQRLNNAFQSWKGDLGQVDDVCVIGIRL